MNDDDLKEVEIDNVSVDIDMEDADDPLAVVDYVKDIYAFYRESEVNSCFFSMSQLGYKLLSMQGSCRICPSYMSNQTDINDRMRAILIDWLIEVP